MARASTTSDVFNAIAEPHRRRLVELLASASRSDVTDLVEMTGLSQSAVSKHLGVLRKVGVVHVEKVGQRRIYTLNPAELKAVHDWISYFENLWTDHLQTIRQVAEQKTKQLAQRRHKPSRPSV